MQSAVTTERNVAARQEAPALARYLPATARMVMGLVFLVMGLNGFLSFLPQPATLPAKGVAFFGAMMQTGYLVPLISGTQVVVALLLLSNRFVPLALAIIAPVVVNIALYHAFLSPTAGVPLATVILVLELYLASVYRAAFRPMLAVR